MKGCRFIAGDPAGDATVYCGKRRLAASSYCATHHALCYHGRGSTGERGAKRFIVWLARRGGLVPESQVNGLQSTCKPASDSAAPSNASDGAARILH